MKKALLAAIAVNALALLGLLVYSLERSIWVFSLYEVAAEPAIAAAAVIEVAAVALIISAGALDTIDDAAKSWANRALGAILSVQALANLTAGYLRGGRQALALFGQADDMAAYAVGAVLWLVVNLAVPVLVLSLSKLLERLISAAVASSPTPAPVPSYVYARPAEPAQVPIYVEPASNSEGARSNTSNTPAVADKVCKYCNVGGLTQAQLLAHGRARSRRGTCAG